MRFSLHGLRRVLGVLALVALAACPAATQTTLPATTSPPVSGPVAFPLVELMVSNIETVDGSVLMAQMDTQLTPNFNAYSQQTLHYAVQIQTNVAVNVAFSWATDPVIGMSGTPTTITVRDCELSLSVPSAANGWSYCSSMYGTPFTDTGSLSGNTFTIDSVFGETFIELQTQGEMNGNAVTISYLVFIMAVAAPNGPELLTLDAGVNSVFNPPFQYSTNVYSVTFTPDILAENTQPVPFFFSAQMGVAMIWVQSCPTSCATCIQQTTQQYTLAGSVASGVPPVPVGSEDISHGNFNANAAVMNGRWIYPAAIGANCVRFQTSGGGSSIYSVNLLVQAAATTMPPATFTPQPIATTPQVTVPPLSTTPMPPMTTAGSTDLPVQLTISFTISTANVNNCNYYQEILDTIAQALAFNPERLQLTGGCANFGTSKRFVTYGKRAVHADAGPLSTVSIPFEVLPVAATAPGTMPPNTPPQPTAAALASQIVSNANNPAESPMNLALANIGAVSNGITADVTLPTTTLMPPAAPPKAPLVIDFKDVLSGVMKCVTPHTWTVNVGNAVGAQAFTPQGLTIVEGDTVQWIWQGAMHSVTQTTGLGSCTPMANGFDTGVQSPPFFFSYTFLNPGTYYFMSSPDCHSGEVVNMWGWVTVTAYPGANPPLGVGPMAPNNGAAMWNVNGTVFNTDPTGPGSVVLQFQRVFC